MPDLDLLVGDDPRRVFELLHDARPLLLNLGVPGAVDVPRPAAVACGWSRRATRGTWELPVLGAVSAPDAVLVRPDGYVAWVGDGTQAGLAEALATWFGAP